MPLNLFKKFYQKLLSSLGVFIFFTRSCLLIASENHHLSQSPNKKEESTENSFLRQVKKVLKKERVAFIAMTSSLLIVVGAIVVIVKNKNSSTIKQRDTSEIDVQNIVTTSNESNNSQEIRENGHSNKNSNSSIPIGDNHNQKSHIGEELKQRTDLTSNNENKNKYDQAIKHYLKDLDHCKEKKLSDHNSRYTTIITSIANDYIQQAKKESDIKVFKDQLGRASRQYGDILYTIGKTYFKKENYTEALKYYEKARLAYQDSIGEKNATYTGILYNIGLTYSYQKEYSKARDFFKDATAIYEKNLGTNYNQYGNILNARGDAYYKQVKDGHQQYITDYKQAINSYQSALSVFKKTSDKKLYAATLSKIANIYLKRITDKLDVKIFEDKYDKNTREYGDILYRIGKEYYEIGKYIPATKHYEQAYFSYKETLKNDKQAYTDFFNDIGSAYRYSKSYDKARDYYKKASLLHEKSDQNYATAVFNIALTHIDEKAYPKALQVYQEMFGADNQTDDQTYAEIMNQIGRSYLFDEEYEKALIYYQKALPLYKKNLTKNHKEYATLVFNIASAYWRQEKYSEALKICEDTLGTDHQTYIKILKSIGNYLDYKKEYKQAITYYEKALPLSQEKLGKNHKDYANIVLLTAYNYINQKEYNKAFELCEKKLGKNNKHYATTLESITLFHREKTAKYPIINRGMLGESSYDHD